MNVVVRHRRMVSKESCTGLGSTVPERYDGSLDCSGEESLSFGDAVEGTEL